MSQNEQPIRTMKVAEIVARLHQLGHITDAEHGVLMGRLAQSRKKRERP